MASFKINKLDFQYVSHNRDYSTTNGICELCKKQLCGQPVVVGTCRHAYHIACFSKFKTTTCPIDNTIWCEAYKS